MSSLRFLPSLHNILYFNALHQKWRQNDKKNCKSCCDEIWFVSNNSPPYFSPFKTVDGGTQISRDGRGTRKDFIDLYFLLQHYSLKEILDFYEKKYPEHSLFRALMSLSYFDDAEKQMMPKMLVQKKWEEMKKV